MSQVIEVSVSAGSDDAEEVQGTGQVFVNSSDLELIDDADYVGQQTVGIRFDGLDIPAGATITAAWIEFTVDERQSVATTLNRQGAGLRRRSDFHHGELQRLQPADDCKHRHLVAARMADRRRLRLCAADRRSLRPGAGSGVAAGLDGGQRHRVHRRGQWPPHGRGLRIRARARRRCYTSSIRWVRRRWRRPTRPRRTRIRRSWWRCSPTTTMWRAIR